MKFPKGRTLLVILGLVMLSLLIWIVGPYVPHGESAGARLIAIAAVWLIWGSWRLYKLISSRRASAKMAAAVAAQQTPADGTTVEAEKVRRRFEEAIDTLKKTQRDEHGIYELPWYVIIGPPGSGKTTSLQNSGLKFPLEQRFGRDALQGVGGTRNCDWWFTDQAVLLDTAGRYMSQDSDASVDAAGWREFLALLLKYRKRRPLNGVIVTLSAADLMTHTPAQREANVAAARRRLDELNRYLKVRLPVYVMVTKCDLISGFNEFFETFDSQQRAQVWGMTFAPERGLDGKAVEDFRPEFDLLVERLNQLIFSRMDAERDTRRRAAIFGFPQQLAGLRDLINAFVTGVFSETRFDGRQLLRGLYFTSGTQEGMPIDRLMGAIGRGFGISGDTYAPSVSGRGKAFFIERLFRDVLFAEAGFAGVNRRREWQFAALQLATYITLILIAIVGVIVLTVSYSRNKSYLKDVAEALAVVQRVGIPTADQGLPQKVTGLDALRSLDGVATRYDGHMAWSLRWGLFQGNDVGEEAREGYLRVLNGTLLPVIGDLFKNQLKAASAEPDKLYQYLKAYLMLHYTEHLDKNQLFFLVNIDWQERFGGDPDVLQSLNLHLHSLLDHQKQLRPLPVDDTLVAEARRTVQQASLPKLIYNQLKLIHTDDTSHDLRLDIAAGAGSERALKRKSGRQLSEPVPGLYTRTVFDQVAGLGTVELVKQFSEDNWVMGDKSFGAQGSLAMASQVMEVYADDYIKTWDAILNDIAVVPMQSLAQAADALSLLGSPGSPLKGFLAAVETNTNMSKPAEGAQGVAASAVSGAASTLMNPLGKLFAPSSKPASAGLTPPQRITQHFASVDQLVAGGAGAPIDRVIAQVGQISQKMNALGAGTGETSPLDALVHAGQGEAVKSLSQMAQALPPPVDVMVAEIGGRSATLAVDQARTQLDQLYREQVVKECTAIVSGHYPFYPSSTNDVQPFDFAHLFGPNGTFDAFFKQNLALQVDSDHSPWVWRPNASGPAGSSTAMLRQFELAHQIRDNFLDASGQLAQQFFVSPGVMDTGLSRFTLEFDGQSLDYRFGPVQRLAVRWPGPTPGTASVSFVDREGAQNAQSFPGAWAWFRLLDSATLRAESDVKFDATFQNNGHQATVLIEAQSIRNAFQKTMLRQFRCN